MQDRFKFRVWSNKQKKMYYWSDIIKIPNFGYALFVDNRALGEGLWFKQQSTGLKDKYGKLIYEGDIVKIGNGSINGSVIEKIILVKWGINSWNIPSWITDIPDFSHYAVVIGNVYENPELLEAK